MTVNSTNITSGPYTGNGASDQYSYTFRVTDKTQLKIFETTDLGARTELTVDTDYTVANIGDAAGGIITRVAGNLPSNYTWYIRSNYKYTQLSPLSSQGGFFPDIHEDAFDKLTFLIQQLEDTTNRCIRLSDDIDIDGVLTIDENALARAGLFVAFDSNGDLLLSSGSGTPTSPFMATVNDDDDAFEATGTLKTDYVVATKAEAEALTISSGRTVFVTSRDGGLFQMVAGAPVGTYSDDGGAFTGTRFTAGDGSSGFLRQEFLTIPTYLNAIWFGAVDAGNNVTAVNLMIAAIIDGAGTTVFIPNSTFDVTIVFDKSDVTIDCNMNEMSFNVNYVKGGQVGVPWDETFFNTLWVFDAEKINVVNTRFDQGAFNRTAIFLWHAVAANYCVVDRCFFSGIIYQTIDVNGVAIQTAPGTYGIKITNNNFYDCAAAVSLKGYNGIIDNCTHYITAAQVTGVAGSTDQAFGLDGSDGSRCTNCTVIRGVGAPQAGADIGANSSTNYIIANCYVSGFTGGRAFFMQGSSKGLIDGNIVDGKGYTSVAAWTMFNIEDVSGDNVISNNILRNPPITTSFGRGIEVSASNNIVRGNRIEMGTADKTFAGIAIVNGDTPGYLTIDNNHIECANTGIYFDGITDNGNNPIQLSNNTYAGVMTTAWGNSGAFIRNIPIYIENEKFIGVDIATFSIPKYSTYFGSQKTGQLDHRITDHTSIHGAVVPSIATVNLTTWRRGDVIVNSIPTAKSSIKYWRCLTSGTFDNGATVSEAGTTTSGSPIITAMAVTTDIIIGDIMTATAGFAALTELKVLSKTSTTVTVDQDANATGAATVTLTQPVFEAVGEVKSAARMAYGTAQSIPNNTVTVIDYDTETYDNLSEFDASGRFTAIEAGVYHVDAVAQLASAGWAVGEYIRLIIRVNGSTYTYGTATFIQAGFTASIGASASADVKLTAGQYIEIAMIHTQGGAVSVAADGGQHNVSIHRVD